MQLTSRLCIPGILDSIRRATSTLRNRRESGRTPFQMNTTTVGTTNRTSPVSRTHGPTSGTSRSATVTAARAANARPTVSPAPTVAQLVRNNSRVRRTSDRIGPMSGATLGRVAGIGKRSRAGGATAEIRRGPAGRGGGAWETARGRGARRKRSGGAGRGGRAGSIGLAGRPVVKRAVGVVVSRFHVARSLRDRHAGRGATGLQERETRPFG